ncbi:MAG: 2'-5' RNA ligase family protein [Waterburya sp.]
MKLTRSIVIFPQFGSDLDLIQNIRHQYDPLASKIAPHITLVFPFESEISSKTLRQHIKTSLEGFKPFSLSLRGISHEEGNYLFLNPIKGQEQIIKLHDLLYSGILKRFLSQKHDYKPHITVAHLQDSLATEAAIDKLKTFDHEFTTEVNKITTEIILEDLTSKIDFAVTLT